MDSLLWFYTFISSFFISTINEISVSAGLVAFVILLFKKNKTNLGQTLIIVFSASAIPTGIALLFCSLKPSIISNLQGINIHIAAAGIALLYLSKMGLSIKTDNNSALDDKSGYKATGNTEINKNSEETTSESVIDEKVDQS